jgi:hypothetical protein
MLEPLVQARLLVRWAGGVAIAGAAPPRTPRGACFRWVRRGDDAVVEALAAVDHAGRPHSASRKREKSCPTGSIW